MQVASTRPWRGKSVRIPSARNREPSEFSRFAAVLELPTGCVAPQSLNQCNAARGALQTEGLETSASHAKAPIQHQRSLLAGVGHSIAG